MVCESCGSENQTQFHCEITIHCSGLSNLNRPGALVFPTLAVCLNCRSFRKASFVCSRRVSGRR